MVLWAHRQGGSSVLGFDLTEPRKERSRGHCAPISEIPALSELTKGTEISCPPGKGVQYSTHAPGRKCASAWVLDPAWPFVWPLEERGTLQCLSSRTKQLSAVQLPLLV